jgi:hypothetical protein
MQQIVGENIIGRIPCQEADLNDILLHQSSYFKVLQHITQE